MKPISFIIPSRNTLNYLKVAYKSIRKNLDPMHEIVMLDDASDDNKSVNWLNSIRAKDNKVKTYLNTGSERLGHTILFDQGVEIATNDIIVIGHSDMYFAPGFDTSIMKLLKPGVVISATRIEPSLHPAGPEKHILDFGILEENFEEQKFLDKAKELAEENKGRKTKGIFAPWAIYKKDFINVGGHDTLFAPQSREDSDIFNRFVLAGYKVFQARDAFVYHFTCRGSRFKDGIGKNSEEWMFTNYKGERNFIRKWGSMVLHDSLMKPIISPFYSITMTLDVHPEVLGDNLLQLLQVTEPRVNRLIIFGDEPGTKDIVEKYIQEESKITAYDLKKRIFLNPSTTESFNDDIEIYTTNRILQSDNLMFIQMLQPTIDNMSETGMYEYAGNRIRINKLDGTKYLQNIYNKTSIVSNKSK